MKSRRSISTETKGRATKKIWQQRDSLGRLLIVDDDPQMQKVYKRIFWDHEYEIHYASSGEEALKKAFDLKPDIVLLDIMMPGIDGYEVCRQLKTSNETEETDVIFISAKGGTYDKLKAYRKRATDFVIKPFNPEELVAKVRVILERRRFFLNLAYTDQLTKLKNRRAFDEHFDIIFKTARRHSRTFSLALLDIDHFKKVNDTYGHHLGDFVLGEISKRIEKNIRETDILARIGGDEFAVLMPETDKIAAISIFERLKKGITFNALIRPGYEDALRITVSMGVASFPDDAWNKEDLFKQADKALYLAKQKVRNKIDSRHP